VVSIQPLWLQSSAGRLFCIAYRPEQIRSDTAGLLIVPPFAEEMNKCRRMTALIGRAASARGHLALVVDLFGTGDSEGDFGEASVPIWQSDVVAGARYLALQGVARLDVLAIRSGALLLHPAMTGNHRDPGRLVLWQPVTSGKQHMSQFLRLRLGGDLVGNTTGSSLATIRDEMLTNGYVEVAGYRLSRSLVAQLESADLAQTVPSGWRDLHWFDVGVKTACSLSPGAARVADELAAQGRSVTRRTIAGEPFWGTPEIAIVPALVTETTDCLCQGAVP